MLTNRSAPRGPRAEAGPGADGPSADGPSADGPSADTPGPDRPSGVPGPDPNLDLDALFQALAHPVRRGILEALREGDRTVGELAGPLPLSRPAVSQHLDVLERVGLVRRVPSGRQNLCRLTGAPLGGAANWLQAYARYWTGAFDRLERHFLEPTPREEPEP